MDADSSRRRRRHSWRLGANRRSKEILFNIDPVIWMWRYWEKIRCWGQVLPLATVNSTAAVAVDDDDDDDYNHGDQKSKAIWYNTHSKSIYVSIS